MKLTLNIQKVSLLTLVLVGGFSMVSFESAYSGKGDEAEKKEGKVEGEVKKDEDKGPKAEKAPEKKEAEKKTGKLDFVENTDKVSKGIVDQKLTVSTEKKGKVTKVKDELGKERLKIDLTTKQLQTTEIAILQDMLAKVYWAKPNEQNLYPKTVIVIFNDNGTKDYSLNFSGGVNGVWKKEFSTQDPKLSDIAFSPLAKDGKVRFEMTDVPPEFLSKVESEVWSPEFSARQKAWGDVYARIAGIQAYIGAIDRMGPFLREREHGAYGIPGEVTAFKGVDGGKSLFDSRNGVIVTATEEARVLWSMMAPRPAMITLDLPVDDWRARQILENYDLKEQIMLKDRVVYDLSQDSRVMKRIMEENALGSSASWIFKMYTPQEVEPLRLQWVDKFDFNVTKMDSMMEPRPGSKMFTPEILAELDQKTQDLDGWIKDGDTLGYKGGVGSFIYEKENGALAVFDLTTAGHLVDRIASDPYRANATMGIVIDDLRYPGFRNRYLQDVDYVVADDGKLSFQGLSARKVNDILYILPFYEVPGGIPYGRGFSDAGVMLAINGIDIKSPDSFPGKPEDFIDYALEGERK
ncbi:MAG: hypothetical protein B7Y25_02235 [Alphaproteobacteria bacterium 16-39-46]|nr:MAG: hypothetical protein B7Y25_02235 [Alphaproteobacteria bacterium 16-39-46]OZA43669.1 MAG: hypothetical protein B7X84_02515 [Alphaproteobacteria bacterium 17-39-52]HQS83733.1 hypothetical protein [Alphaproteobacteria bacterium]HQS93508.1 hypothetical protein [Alphaproteobacteria bacterium]